MLLDISRTTVKDPHQSFLVEVADLVFQRLYVIHVIALWQPKVGNCWSGNGIIEE